MDRFISPWLSTASTVNLGLSPEGISCYSEDWIYIPLETSMAIDESHHRMYCIVDTTGRSLKRTLHLCFKYPETVNNHHNAFHTHRSHNTDWLRDDSNMSRDARARTIILSYTRMKSAFIEPGSTGSWNTQMTTGLILLNHKRKKSHSNGFTSCLYDRVNSGLFSP